MEIFLEKDTRRLVEILNEYFTVKDEWSITEITKKNGYTYKTTQNDFEKIKNIIEMEQFKDYVQFEELGKGNYKIVMTEGFNYNLFRQYFLEQSTGYLFIRDLLLGKSINKNNFEKQYFISYPNFKKKYAYVFDLLDQFDLELDIAMSFVLNGTEKQIRYFLVCFFIGTLNYCGMLPKHDLYAYIDHRFSKNLRLINEKMNYSISLGEKYRIAIMMFVSSLRLTAGHCYETDEFAYTVSDSIMYKVFSKEMSKWLKEYIKDDEIVKNEMIFLFAFFNLFPANEANNGYHEQNIENYKEDKYFTYRMSKIFVDYLKAQYGESLANEETRLYSNLLPLHFQMTHFSGDISLFNDTQIEFTTYNDELLYECVNKLEQDIFKDYIKIVPHDKMKIVDRNKEVLLLKYHAILKVSSLPQLLFAPIYLKIVSSEGEYIEQYLFEKIKSSLGEFNLIFESHVTAKTDIIVTDIVLPVLEDMEQKYLFTWQGIINPYAVERLRKALIKINDKKRHIRK